MENTPTFKELLDAVNGRADELKACCTIGLFANEYQENAENTSNALREIGSLIFKKPVVSISSFLEENEIYYDVRFLFRSVNDSDYKQMWSFFCRYADRAKREADQLAAGETLTKITALTLSILPDTYRGKHFVYINMPFWETISRSENAFDKSASISFICNDESLAGMTADDDMVDRHSIDQEVEQELLAEFEDQDSV